MSRMTVSRSYKQLMAERTAMRLMIEEKEGQLKTDENLTEQGCKDLTSELQSDKALLKEIENDIQMFRERNMGGCRG